MSRSGWARSGQWSRLELARAWPGGQPSLPSVPAGCKQLGWWTAASMIDLWRMCAGNGFVALWGQRCAGHGHWVTASMAGGWASAGHSQGGGEHAFEWLLN